MRMKEAGKTIPWLALGLILALWAVRTAAGGTAQAADQLEGRGVAGYIKDAHGDPVRDADLKLYVGSDAQPVAEAVSQLDGAYLLILPDSAAGGSMRVEVARPHFWPQTWKPTPAQLSILLESGSMVTHDVVLERRINLSFWIATLCFAGMLVVVALERLHNTLAALLAVAVIFTVSLVGGSLNPELIILDFNQALEFVDFDVIFLLMGMMIVIGVIESTGIYQWLAYQAYRLSRGKVWLLALILMLITLVTSSMLDNAISMLLISPITLEIALVLGINPLSLLIPALLSANVGGMATLVGTPVNIMIGSYTGLGFNEFLAHLTPSVLLAEVGLVIYCLIRYRKEHRATAGKPSRALLKRLEANSRIENPVKMRKALGVFGGLLLLFIFGEGVHLTPSVASIIGAVVMLLWVHPDIEQMMGVVDWTTLIFFIALFMVIGAVEEVGLLSLVADGISGLVGTNLPLAVLVVVWVSAILSASVDNIPFAASMLPVVAYLSRIIPGAGDSLLFFALAVGANLGGNGLLVGSSANLVVAGIAERAGYPLSFRRFFQAGFPALVITTALGCVWLFLHFNFR
jgi:Na+/H+ antiporter NhaD/arsenite permease-like protein